jgi:hypothetical protein
VCVVEKKRPDQKSRGCEFYFFFCYVSSNSCLVQLHSHWPPLSVQSTHEQLAPGQPLHWHLPFGQQCCWSGQQQLNRKESGVISPTCDRSGSADPNGTYAFACGQQPSPAEVSQHVCCDLQFRIGSAETKASTQTLQIFFFFFFFVCLFFVECTTWRASQVGAMRGTCTRALV